MEAAAEPLIPSAVPRAMPSHPADRDLNSSPSPSPSPPPTARISTSTSTIKPTSNLPWIPLAAMSGFCAAVNGVFAKLTTTALTTSWATAISHGFGLKEESQFIEFVIRASFFLLNLAFNALMWGLFTAALTRASSTTRVSIINTSANFMLTAMAGWAIFGEKLNGLWWVGAAGLVVGNVVIGRRDEDAEESAKGRPGAAVAANGRASEERREVERERYRDSIDGVGSGGGMAIGDGVALELEEERRRNDDRNGRK